MQGGPPFSQSLRALAASHTSPSTGVPPETWLSESDAQAVLFVRAVEEADPEGELLDPSERTRATERARDAEGFQAFVVQRARDLVEVSDRHAPGLARLRRASRLRLAAAWIVVPALAIGLATNLVGSEKRINVLANPLAGLFLWNLAIYVLILLGFLRRRARLDRSVARPASASGVELASRLLTWPARASSRLRASGDGRKKRVARAVVGYLAGWNRCAMPLLGARLEHALHLGATALVVGALGGMYARGLLLEYRATWESTFLGPAQVHAWLGLLLGPASTLTGIELPGLDAIERLRAPESGNAASWIHLYAVTTVLLVVVPRALLAVVASAHTRRVARSLRVDTRALYYRRLHARARGADVRAIVVPYSYTPTAPRIDRLKAILHDVLGARASISVGRVLEYGDELAAPGEPAGEDEHPIGRILLFNLGQTPESEVHGRLLEDLVSASRAGGSCLVLVDAAAWRERAGDTTSFDKRIAERRRTWDRVVRESGLEAVHLDLDREPPDDVLERIEHATFTGDGPEEEP